MGKLLDLGGFQAVNVGLKKYIDVIEHKVDLNSEGLLSHKHTVSQIIDFPVALINPYSLIIKLNDGTIEGTNMFTYDGGSSKILNITASSIGAAPVSHNHSYLPLSGGRLSGNVAFTEDNQLSWARNTDYLKIGFKNDGDSDTDSYGYIRTGDNGNEYFRIESISESTTTTIASFKREGVRLGIGKFIGNLSGVADVATKLGSTTVGGTAKPIYLNAGVPTALSASIGAANKPIFMNAGTLTASNATIGSATVPVFMNAGAITACTSLSLNTTGSAAKWTNARTLTLTGAINGSVSIDGSGNVSLATLEGNVSFKRRGTVSATMDWNTLFDPGCYKVQMAAWGDKTKYHAPNEYADMYSFGLLLVYDSAIEAENRTVQIYLPHNSTNSTLGLVMTRMYNGNAWNAWQPIFKGVTKSYVGLGNVDNTSDSNKSVASAAKWTTARTLIVGNTGKLVSGLDNVAWSLAEIGAAPASGSTSISKLASTITLGDGDSAAIYQNGATYRQKFEIVDNSTAGDAVFRFSQSTNSGSSFITLLTINDDGNIIANKFTGSLVGNAATASKWAMPRTLSLTGSVTGSVSIDGSGNISLATTTNHTHSYLPLTGGLMSANSMIRFRSSTPDGGRAMGMAYMDSADNSKTVAGIGTLYSKDIVSRIYMGVSSEPWDLANGLTITSDLIRFKNNIIWHAGNDGSGSGLDADLLDGKQASAFANVTHTHNYAGSTSAGGAANSLTYFKNTSTVDVGVDTTDANAIGYVSGISLLGQKDGGLIKQVYSSVWMGEIYIDYRTGQLCSRGKNNGTLQPWRTQIDSGNYTSYCPTKTGSGASGTWGISITGNAATATKATQDGSGNTITTKYVTVDTGQTISGVKTFSSEQRFSAQNGFRLINGNYGVIFRNSDNLFYMLLTNSGNASSGSWNSLRPFYINLATGLVTIGNGLVSSGIASFTNTTEATSATSGAVIVSGGLGVAKQIITNSGIYVGHANAANAIIYLNSKRAIAGTDAWLRINDTKAFTSGVYFGSSLIRTDGSFQVGASGSSVNITTSAIQLKTPTTISNTATITGVASITNTTASTSKTTGALKVSGGVGVAGKINAQSLGINDTWTIQLGATGSIDFILN